ISGIDTALHVIHAAAHQNLFQHATPPYLSLENIWSFSAADEFKRGVFSKQRPNGAGGIYSLHLSFRLIPYTQRL
ncbi:MAG: hypothetical protein K6F62_06490, partial [Schwartzia sp.]|nr:hypothetical protein [Schwartzia sp. (in: firmicutes)]